MLGTCAFCEHADEAVCVVAACTARCDVLAHPGCFANRQRSALWRKKHHFRGPTEAELCPHLGCLGKLRRGKHEDDEDHRPYKATCGGGEQTRVLKPLDDPNHPCSFLGRDGTACRRAAVGELGACRLHSRAAAVIKQMVGRQEREKDEASRNPVDGVEEARLEDEKCYEERRERRKDMRRLKKESLAKHKEKAKELDAMTKQRDENARQLEVVTKQRDENARQLEVVTKQRDENARQLEVVTKQRDENARQLEVVTKQRDENARQLEVVTKQRDENARQLEVVTKQRDENARQLEGRTQCDTLALPSKDELCDEALVEAALAQRDEAVAAQTKAVAAQTRAARAEAEARAELHLLREESETAKAERQRLIEDVETAQAERDVARAHLSAFRTQSAEEAARAADAREKREEVVRHEALCQAVRAVEACFF